MCKTGSYDEIFPLIEREKVTITGIVPSLARMWLEVLSWDNSFNLSSLKRIVIGGALVEKELIKDMVKQFPCDIHIGYGATEGIIMYNVFNRNSSRINNGYKGIQREDDFEKSIPYGYPLANQKFYVLNENLQSCPDWWII